MHFLQQSCHFNLFYVQKNTKSKKRLQKKLVYYEFSNFEIQKVFFFKFK
jgi:hypothetical protein